MASKIRVTNTNYKTLGSGNYYIGDGLLYQVRGDSRLWVYRYQVKGVRKHVTIGSAKHITLARAKFIASNYRAKRAVEPDAPLVEPQRPEVKAIPTFEEYFPTALETLAGVKRWSNEKHAKQWDSTIRTYAYPVLRKKPLNTITRDDVLAILKPIWNKKTETASRLRGRLQEVFGLAKASDYMTDNPAVWRGNLSLFLPSPANVREVKHFAALTVEELRQCVTRFNSTDRIGMLCTVFGALTCTRAQEFCKMQWKEVDLEDRVWTIPSDHTKMKKEHRVPLSTQAVRILERLPRKSEYVFATRGSHVNPQTPRVLLRKESGLPTTMHGCRSTFRDWCAEHLIHDAVAEACLSHVVGNNKVVRAYLRSDLLDNRRPVMQQWADTILPL